MSKKTWTGRVYLGRTAEGKQRIKWVGRFETKRERDAAVAKTKLELERSGGVDLPTCDEYVDKYLAHYERVNKDSSADTQRSRLQRFKADFAGRSLAIRRSEARDWAHSEGRWAGAKPVPPSCIPPVVSLYNFAIDEDDLPLERNPFRKLSHRTKGRSELPPPTEEEFQGLLDACSALGEYAPMMRALIRFSAFTLMRPSECFALEWADIDFERMRINKVRRLYRGALAEPKTGPKVIALTPPARDAIIGLRRDSELVFTNRIGGRIGQPTMTSYWGKIKARAALEFDFYHATKHYGVHYMWTVLGMSPRAIAAQAGWKLSTVNKMLEVYGHAEVGALEEVDQAFENVVPFKPKVVGE